MGRFALQYGDTVQRARQSEGQLTGREAIVLYDEKCWLTAGRGQVGKY
jgi:hypothetical protein